MNLQDLYTALSNHFNDYGHQGGLGTTLDTMIDDLLLSNHEWRVIRRVINLAYYK